MTIAFDPRAGNDERVAAVSEVQRAAMPALSDLLPGDAVRDVVEHIRSDMEEQAFAKSMSADIVPFPSSRARSGARGMQSVEVDEWQLSLQGDYYERPSAFGFDSLRAMVDQTPVLNAVIMTRVRQVQRFCRGADSNVDAPGFEIRHADRKHELTQAEAKTYAQVAHFFGGCGWERNPRKRRALGRDSFPQFMAKAVRDTLSLDAVAIETEYKRNRRLGMDGFYLVDGGSVRLCPEIGYRGDPDVYALQVVQGRICSAYGYEDLIYEPRNPRSDVLSGGYGLPETEILVRVVTGFLNAMNLNLRGFTDNAIPRGVLHLSGNYSQEDLVSFRRYWNSMVKGVNSSWSVPVLISKDQESKASFEKFGVDIDDVLFSKWMTFLVSIICAVYGMSPAEINFDAFSGGTTSPLSGSDTSERLAASKDSGLRPLLAYFENLFTDYIATEFGDDLVFRWTGLDPVDAEKRHELRKAVLTVNEIRAEEGYEPLEGPLGDAPLNPSLVGPWMQLTQSDPEDGAPEGDEGEPQGEGDEPQGEEEAPEDEPAEPEAPDPEPPEPAEDPGKIDFDADGRMVLAKSLPVYVLGA